MTVSVENVAKEAASQWHQPTVDSAQDLENNDRKWNLCHCEATILRQATCKHLILTSSKKNEVTNILLKILA